MVKARNEGRDYFAEGADILKESAKRSLESRQPGWKVPLPALGDDARRGFLEPRFDLEPAWRLVAMNRERAANAGEDRLARIQRTAPLRARHWLWKVAPSGAARSR